MKLYFITSVIILVLAILKVLYTAESVDPCLSQLNNIVADMCIDDFVEESSVAGNKLVNSVLVRITKHQNNCMCHITLRNTVTNHTIYMSKYKEQSNAAPEQHNCGLAVDVEYVDTSDTTRSLQSINCTNGTGLRSVALGGNELKLKSRIISGDFTRGYCMQIYRTDQAIYNCNMKDQVETAGSDGDWIQTSGVQHTSLNECKRYCLNTEHCVAVHYDPWNYCFVYNRTTRVFKKDKSTYSQKDCVDTQNHQANCPLVQLKIQCVDPEKTTTIPSTSQDEKSELYIFIGAGVGGVLMIIVILLIILFYIRSNQPGQTIGIELHENKQYEDLNASRLSSNYNSINLSTVTS